MSALYVTEPRSTLRRQDQALVVTREGEEGEATRQCLARVPPHRLELVGLVGDVHITADATHLCLDQGITVAWLTEGGYLRGRLVPPVPRSGDLRVLQYRASVDPAWCLSRARSVVAAKLANAAGLLAGLRGNYPSEPAFARGAELHELRERVATAATLESLLGLEGAAARVYFEALRAAFRGEIRFTGRQQHPPPDPANALLSFGYVLLGNRLAGLVEARGLDPAVGFFHGLRPGRAALSLDLLEEFRQPVVDRLVLRLCNLRVMRLEHFEPDAARPGGVRMTRVGLRRFLGEWEKLLQRPLRERDEASGATADALLRRQVERLAADLRGGEAYRPAVFGEEGLLA